MFLSGFFQLRTSGSACNEIFLSVCSACNEMFLSVCVFSCEQVDPRGSPDLEKALPPLKRIAADATAVINLPVINWDLLRIHITRFLKKLSNGQISSLKC